jgi:hypothetical protein
MKDIPCPPIIPPAELGDPSSFIIDGQALVVAIGKPNGIFTSGDPSGVFRTTDLQGCASFEHIDIVFYRYNIRNQKMVCEGHQTNLQGH